ncbi:MAG: HEAT repeat domain-containing protein [Armatimonadota bacterium]
MTCSNNNYLEHYLRELREGDAENAYHSLVEAGPAVLPELIEAFNTESCPNMRATLVKVVWQFGLPETIPFLSQALADNDPQVWKSVLDGLVSMPCNEALAALEKARDRQFDKEKDGQIFKEWVEEALGQIRASISM